MTNITEQYICPKCSNTFPMANKKLHDLRCKAFAGSNDNQNANPLQSFGVPNNNHRQYSQNSNDQMIYEEMPAFGHSHHSNTNSNQGPVFPRDSRNGGFGLDNQSLEQALNYTDSQDTRVITNDYPTYVDKSKFDPSAGLFQPTNQHQPIPAQNQNH